MSFPSPTMEEPRQDSLPSETKGNKTTPQKKNSRAKRDHHQPKQSQPSSPSLNSIPSSTVSSKPAPLADSETISTASLESSKSSRRRRRARGGGRKNRSKNHIASQQQHDDLDGSQTIQHHSRMLQKRSYMGMMMACRIHTGVDKDSILRATQNTNTNKNMVKKRSLPIRVSDRLIFVGLIQREGGQLG